MQMTRLELYKKVCDRPLNKLAPEFGISGTALAAVCKRHQIPYPGSGHWTRMALGLPTELPLLPEAPDVIIEILPAVVKPKKDRTLGKVVVRKPKRVAKIPRPVRHPLLIRVEEHLLKTRKIGEGEFLRPYKRILPDLISSAAALPKAVAIANDLYLALDEQGYRVHIADAANEPHRIRIWEQEVQRKDRKYGRYNMGSIWAPDRPTVFYVDTVPIAIAVTEMTEHAMMRYLNGGYHREDSKLIRSAKSWQLTHSWTTEQDIPCGRFRIVAFSPKKGVDWSLSWQETMQVPLESLIPEIVKILGTSKDTLQRLMDAEEAAEKQRKNELDEFWERYAREEDARKTAQALTDSRKQLTEIMESWGRAMIVERFFADAEERLKVLDDQRRQRLQERLTLAKATIESVDPLEYIESWVAPGERHRPKFPQG